MAVPARATATALAVSMLVVGCGYRAVERKGPADLAWPGDDPRIRLQSVIDLGGGLEGGAGKIRRWLGESSSRLFFRRPYALAWDKGDLLVADPDSRLVARIGAQGKITVSPRGLFVQPVAVAACSVGIVVSDAASGKVVLLDRDLRPIRTLAEELSRPTGIACMTDGVVVAETGAHRILVFDAAGDRRVVGRRGNADGEFNFPTSVAVDGRSMLVGDSLNFRIQRIDVDSGEPLGTFGKLGDASGDMPRIKGIAIDGAGHIWVADGYLDQVSLYTTSGALLISIGGNGAEPGEFAFPAGIAAHSDGRIAVADSLNQRVQIFQLLRRAT